MSSDRFHKAAKDGLLNILKEASKRDANSKDVNGMTPVLWAAFEGRLDALRLLIGKGGDPDKCDQFGNTALHLSAAKGYLHCVDFLVKFGVNLYALDIDKHNAKDLAAINSQDDILSYLDVAAANLELNDRKKAKAFRELAEKNCNKRIKEYTKKQQRLEQEYENTKSFANRPTTVLAAIKHKIWASSQGNLKLLQQKEQISANQAKFSDLVGSGTISSRTSGAVPKKLSVFQVKQNFPFQPIGDSTIKMSETDSIGQRTFAGLQRQGDVIFTDTISDCSENGFREKIRDVFDIETTNDMDNFVPRENYATLSRSFSQPNFFNLHPDDEINEELRLQNRGLFDRPVLGSLAFRRSVTAALNQMGPEASSIGSSTSNSGKNSSQSKSREKMPRSFLGISDSDSEALSESDEEQTCSPIQRFLAVWGLEDHLHIFQKQQIDLETLMLLTEGDLKSLGLPLGPFRKLVIAIQERKNAFANPGVILDSRL